MRIQNQKNTMKSTIQDLLVMFFMVIMLSAMDANAQVPKLFNYQGIARDIKGNPLSNQKMSLKLSVLPTADAINAEYEEIQLVITNEFGLYTIQIGNGTPLVGEMKTVKWETGNKYIKIAIDPTGGTNYIDAGTNQLLSVPYAIYADKAGVTDNSGNDRTRAGVISTSAAGTGTINYLTKFTAANTIYNSQIYDNGTSIGIGTATPSALAKLHFLTTVGNIEHIRMQNTNSTGFGKFIMYNDVTASYANFTKYGTAYVGGYAGITTKYPYGNLLAFGNNGQVAGDGKGRFLITSAGNIGISLSKGGTSKLKFHADFTTENVSIGGNADPVNRVHLNNTDGTDMTVGITNNTSGHTAADGLLIRENGNAASIINKENSTLSLGTNNAATISILANGNTGIGTISPTTKLDVSGQVRIQGGLPGKGKVLTSDSTGLAVWQTPTWVTGFNGFDNFLPKFFGGGDTLLNSSIADNGLGQVGIGTLFPTNALHIKNSSSSIRLEDGDDNTFLYIGAPDPSNFATGGIGTITNHELPFFTNNVEHLVIKADGKIGINTNTPVADFEVNGNIKADTIFASTYSGFDTAGYFVAKSLNIGVGNKYGVYANAINGANNYAVYGRAISSANNYGVSGNALNGTDNYGVYGTAFLQIGKGTGVYGRGKQTGVFGQADSASVSQTNYLGLVDGFKEAIGVFGKGKMINGQGYFANIGVAGSAVDNTNFFNIGVLGEASPNNPNQQNYAGYFIGRTYVDGLLGAEEAYIAGSLQVSNGVQLYGTVNTGNLNVVGMLTKLGGSFKIDHPQDPANKFLIHSFVESPDMMNIYNGNIISDQKGEAIVMLPTYFEAENKEYRYQLTVIGKDARAFVKEEIQNNQFIIKSSEPNTKVSWQVTGVRKDTWANEHRIIDVVEKTSAEKNLYLHPEFLNVPATKGLRLKKN